MRRIFYILMFVCVFLFYWNTGINNHTEADDTFEYSRMVEAESHAWLYHPHHLLYGASAKGLYSVVKAFGYDGRAFSFLVFISSLSAAGAVFLFYRFCYRRYSMRPVSSLFAAGLLALSYGFWRYACEAEVILPAGFLVLLSVYLATSPESNRGQVVLAAFVSGISVLFHVLNGVPVFIALPLFYLLKRRVGYAFLHVAVATTVVLAAYLLVFSFEPHLVFGEALPATGSTFSFASIIKGTIGLGQCITAGNFLFGFEGFSSKLMELFPSRMLAEEVYMGRHMSVAQYMLPMLSLVLLLAAVGYGFFRAVVAWRRAFRSDRMHAMLMVGGWQTIAVIGLWFAVYALAILYLEPGNPEVWVLGMIPFWLLFCGLVISPIAHANELWVVLAILLFLGFHNYVGGIGLLKDPATDYNQQKAAWVLEHAGQNDLVVTAGNPVFLRYLNYYAQSGVVDLNLVGEEGLESLFDKVQRVYLLNDVFDYPPSMRIRFPSSAERIDAYAAELGPHADKIMDNEFGGVWELRQNDFEADAKRGLRNESKEQSDWQ